MTITAAVPRPDFWLCNQSKSMIAPSHRLAGSSGTDEPPGITALRFFQPPRTPPQWRSRSSLSPIDIASSTTQGAFTWPEMAKILVPVLLGRPKLSNQEAPRRRMVGTTAIDSTLLTVVGQP